MRITVTTRRELALLRVVSQRLVGPAPGSPTDAVRWLGAVQAQDLPGALVSVALRTREESVSGVLDALDRALVVRTWPVRGTLHLVPAVDAGWMCALAEHRYRRKTERRHHDLGITQAVIARARGVLLTELESTPRMTRAEVVGCWERAGVHGPAGFASHLIGALAVAGDVVQGPCGRPEAPATSRPRDALVVAASRWIPDPVRLERETALGTWATRFFRSHGPATVSDFARWTGLAADDVRVAVDHTTSPLDRREFDGTEYLLDPETSDLLADHRPAATTLRLLPGFDELLLGYGSRHITLDAEHADTIVPGGNGVFRPTVVDHGRVVGTWRRHRDPARVEAEPFTSFNQRQQRRIALAAAALPR